jgi:HCOMODA/2-hydroxy-3-carboxy-muconic semialdehyde decarboxylase
MSENQEKRAAAFQDLIVANQILTAKGVLDAFGHVSVRTPGVSHTFIMARSNVAAKLVTVDDLVEYDFDGRALSQPKVHSHSERYIHAEIYRARPDVGAIVHSHSPSLVPFGVTREVPLRPIYHMAGFLASGVPVFEIRRAAGNGTNMLVDDPERGKSLATVLGSQPVVLMRGHGNTVVGTDIRRATFRAIYTEIAARLQLQAIQIANGTHIEYLSPEEGDAFSNRGSGGGTNRAWDLWVQELTEGSGPRDLV